MIEQLFSCLEQYASFSKKDKALIKSKAKLRVFKAKEIILSEGEISNNVAFVLSGVLRFYYFGPKRKEVTALFQKENEFLANITSFWDRIPSSGVWETETECELLFFSKESWNHLCEKIPKWFDIVSKITNDFLVEKTNFQRLLINEDTKTAYLKFEELYGSILNRVALGHVASFLGMTQSTLSRIRNEIIREQ